jgi:hypothetical protein
MRVSTRAGCLRRSRATVYSRAAPCFECISWLLEYVAAIANATLLIHHSNRSVFEWVLVMRIVLHMRRVEVRRRDYLPCDRLLSSLVEVSDLTLRDLLLVELYAPPPPQHIHPPYG